MVCKSVAVRRTEQHQHSARPRDPGLPGDQSMVDRRRHVGVSKTRTFAYELSLSSASGWMPPQDVRQRLPPDSPAFASFFHARPV